MQLYFKTTYNISKLITKSYSTSFSMATSLFDKEMRDAIYSIYGFVRFADEIVDTFHDYDKDYLLNKFEKDYYDAIKQGISLNPVLQSFQQTVKKYGISDDHIQSFLTSMKNDLVKNNYINKKESENYIYGSADVVGLMCLKVFCNGDDNLYQELEYPARKLGSAFQKVNFLRDLKNDIEILDRRYFPEIQNERFDEVSKIKVIKDIENDFDAAFIGIKKLPKRSKLAVLIAYFYYKNLLEKIKRTSASRIIESRISISKTKKIYLLFKAMFMYKFRLI
ncbi:MAG: phytoene/squalene synthase family protein [Tenuifilaceae bacterium]